MRVEIDHRKLEELVREKDQLSYRVAELVVDVIRLRDENEHLKKRAAKLECALKEQLIKIDAALQGGVDVLV